MAAKSGFTQLPTLYEDGHLRVYKNPTNEIFVEDKDTRATMRISSYMRPGGDGGLQFTTDSLVEPIRVTNMIGWRVGPRVPF